MTHDVFHHDDRIIHQDANAEDQREEGDAVQREAIEVKNEQGQRERGRNGHGHDAALPPAESQPDEDGHAEHGDAHVQQQLVRFLCGSLAVVARDAHGDIGWNDRAFEQVHLADHFVCHGDRIRTGTFGDAERDGRFFVRLGAMEDVLHGLLTTIMDFGHLAQIHGPAPEHAHDHIAHLMRGFQEGTGFHQHLVVTGGEAARTKLPVGLLQHRHQSRRAEVARGQLHGVKHHPHCTTSATQQIRLRYEGHLLDGLIHLGRQPTQREVIVACAVESERKDRHIINALRLDQRRRDSHRNAVEVCAQFFGDLHQAALGVLTHLEAHDDQALAVA